MHFRINEDSLQSKHSASMNVWFKLKGWKKIYFYCCCYYDSKTRWAKSFKFKFLEKLIRDFEEKEELYWSVLILRCLQNYSQPINQNNNFVSQHYILEEAAWIHFRKIRYKKKKKKAIQAMEIAFPHTGLAWYYGDCGIWKLNWAKTKPVERGNLLHWSN